MPIERPSAISSACPEYGVYVACLASYTNGIYHGDWIDLSSCHDVSDIQECIDYIIKSSPSPDAEEYACHDWVGIPSLITSEHPDWNQVNQFMDTITELSDDEVEPYKMWCNNLGEVASEDSFHDAYLGSYRKEEDYAYQLFDELYDLSDNPLASYVDWENVWHDLSCDGYHSEYKDGEYHIFRSI